MKPTFDLGVVLYVCDQEDLVAEAVESLVKQTVVPAKIIVVDDCSEDRSVAKLAPFRQHLTLIRQGRSGVNVARNRALSQLRNEWIALVDANDRWHPDRVAEISRFARANPKVNWMLGRYVRESAPGRRKTLPPEPWKQPLLDAFQSADELKQVLSPATFVARRWMFQKTFGFCTKFRDERIDLQFWRFASLERPVGVLQEPTVEVHDAAAKPRTADPKRTSGRNEKLVDLGAQEDLAYAEELWKLVSTDTPVNLKKAATEAMRQAARLAKDRADYPTLGKILSEYGHCIPTTTRWRYQLIKGLAPFLAKEKSAGAKGSPEKKKPDAD